MSQDNLQKMVDNRILQAGCLDNDGYCGFTSGEQLLHLFQSRCKTASADVAFQVVGFPLLVGAAALTYLQLKRR
jgi:hypothetical protein